MKVKGVRKLKKSAQVHKGFTLVELLVVIAIIAILAAVVVLIINPLELTRRGRDAARLSDMSNLQQAINVAVQEATGSSAASILCTSPATAPCKGDSSSLADGRKSDGTGWVKVNLSAQNSVSVPTLPIDPVNSTGTTGLHYLYCADANAWVMVTDLESQQQQPKRNTDGGSDPLKYEVGSNLTTLFGSGSCTY